MDSVCSIIWQNLRDPPQIIKKQCASIISTSNRYFFVKRSTKNLFFLLTNRQNTKIMFFEKNKKRSVDIETCSGTLILKNPKIHKNNKKTVFLMRSVGVKTIFDFIKTTNFVPLNTVNTCFLLEKIRKSWLMLVESHKKHWNFPFLKWFFRDIALIIEGSKSVFFKLLQVYVAVFLVKRPSKEYKKNVGIL